MAETKNNMNELSKSVEVHLDRQGRLVIPATLGRSLAIFVAYLYNYPNLQFQL
ncbi:hypothetical protein [Gloeocapsa sp. PCC 73106]|uniref:hypothetical protein n=1 Tax=Gloeocapsa sp. PCC 73106 TaxID=102232 RepID=UPI0002ABBE16|nr:hypothetical protein [Gloeocapsa sp. PCC 73106]ELR99373.1 hypothetical protein GLO73106DRAFT_00032230 [Gloeocapsa sp. PCC 73106]